MPKAVINIGYKDYVVELEEAFSIARAICGGERYESKYNGGNSTIHAYQDSDRDGLNIRIITDETYRLAKLAGKPKE